MRAPAAQTVILDWCRRSEGHPDTPRCNVAVAWVVARGRGRAMAVLYSVPREPVQGARRGRDSAAVRYGRRRDGNRGLEPGSRAADAWLGTQAESNGPCPILDTRGETARSLLAFVSEGFAVKLAAGVRVRASSRGPRASIDMRATRLHGPSRDLAPLTRSDWR